MSFSVKDYPVAEMHPDKVKGARGKPLTRHHSRCRAGR